MVTLSAKSEGLDFYRTHELSTVPAVDTLLPLSLSFPPAPSSFSPSLLNVSFLSSLLAEDSFVSFICLHLSSAHLSSLPVESTVPSLPPPGFLFHHPEIPTMTGLLSVSMYKSNSNLISCICCAIVPLFPLFHCIFKQLASTVSCSPDCADSLIARLMVSSLDVISHLKKNGAHSGVRFLQ